MRSGSPVARLPLHNGVELCCDRGGLLLGLALARRALATFPAAPWRSEVAPSVEGRSLGVNLDEWPVNGACLLAQFAAGGELVDLTDSDVRFNSAVREARRSSSRWRPELASMKCVAEALRLLGPEIGDLALTDVRARHLVDLFHKLRTDRKRDLAQRTIYNIYSVISAMFRDAAIVQRIRARCPDGRYDGGSDAELLDLFRRNKRVLNRSDEDVIAAMTHHR